MDYTKAAFQASVTACYQKQRLHGKASIMVESTTKVVRDSEATQDEQKLLINAIEKDDLDLLQSQLNILSNKNISNHMVSVNLPKQWHHVAKKAMSTPLRTAISRRNVKALDLIIKSKCHISQDDLSLGLQKILSRAEGERELDIIRLLIKHGATMEGPVHFTMAFEKLLSSEHSPANICQCERIVQVTCESSLSNTLLGLLLLAVTKRSVRIHDSSINTAAKWEHFSKTSMKMIMETSSFDPKEFIKDTKVWLSLGSTPFQNLVHGLPLLIQMMPGCPLLELSWVLRRVGRHYALTSPEGRTRVRELPALMVAAGMDLSKILSHACLAPRFLLDTGFQTAATRQKTQLPTLMESCRIVVRNNVKCNVYHAMTKTNCIPNAIKDFVLLKDVQPLVWDIDA